MLGSFLLKQNSVYKSDYIQQQGKIKNGLGGPLNYEGFFFFFFLVQTLIGTIFS